MSDFVKTILDKGGNFSIGEFLTVSFPLDIFSEEEKSILKERCANQDRGVRNSAIVREFSEEQYPEAYNELNKQNESTWEKRKNNIIPSVNLRKETEKDK